MLADWLILTDLPDVSCCCWLSCTPAAPIGALSHAPVLEEAAAVCAKQWPLKVLVALLARGL